jgi:hypothetical protein
MKIKVNELLDLSKEKKLPYFSNEQTSMKVLWKNFSVYEKTVTDTGREFHGETYTSI